MKDFVYYTPTKVVFGKDSEKQLPSLLKEFNATKVLLHYGGQSAIKSGLLDEVKEMLDSVGIAYVTLGGVKPNPRLSLVYEGITLCESEHVDFILAIGGGSVIDSAKAIGWGVKSEGDVWDLFIGKKQEAEGTLPIATILTIAAAGSEMSSGSVVTNEEGWLKRSYGHNMSRPKFAIMNPERTMTLPDYQTACGCTDILMHTMERYFTPEAMEISDAIAEGLMRCVIDNSLILVKDPKNYNARAEIMWSGSLAHNDLTGAGNSGGDWCTHDLEHEVGGIFDVAHGAGLAAIWGSWARNVYKDCLPRFVKFAKNVMQVECGCCDEAIALKGIEAMENFYRAIHMPTNFKELGIEVNEQQLRHMAKSCADANGGQKGSAKVLKEEDMYLIFKAANEASS